MCPAIATTETGPQGPGVPWMGGEVCPGARLAATIVHMACRLAVLPLLLTPLLADPPSAGLLGDLILRPFFVLYATALLPPPGGGGGVELTFVAALGGTLDSATVGVTLLWWRLYTFYLSALAGGVMLLRPRRYSTIAGDS